MLSVDTKMFRDAVAKAALAAKAKGMATALGFLHLQADGGRLSVTGTDLEVWIHAECPCEMRGEPLTVLLPADKLKRWLDLVQSETVHLAVDGKGKATLRDARKNFELPTMDPLQFPPSEPVQGASWECPAPLLRSGLRTVHCCESESVRFAMGGVCFTAHRGRRYAAATNGNRMALHAMTDAPDEARQAIVPEASIKRLAALLPATGVVSIEEDTRCIAFAWNGGSLTARLLEGRFPNVFRASPEGEPAARCVVPAAALDNACRAAKLATSESVLGITVTIADGELTLSASGDGESSDSVPIGADSGQASAVYRPDFFIEYLAHCDRGAAVTLSLYPSDGPAVLETDDGFRLVAMPLAK